MLIVVLVLVFFAIAGILVGTYVYYNRRALAAAAALRERLHGGRAAEELPRLTKDASVSHLPFLDRILRDQDITGFARVQLERAGVVAKPSVFLLSSALAGVVGLALGARQSALMAFLLLGAGLAAPWLWVRWKQRRRLAAFDAGFPDTLDMMSNAMRAGYSFQAAAHFIGDEVAAPVGPEFARFYEEQRLGIAVRTALLNMQDRIDSLNLKMFVTAVLIQRETGGNLTELLGNLSTLMRERVALRGHIDTLTAEPKMSARFLVALPVLLFLGLSWVTPTFITPFRTSAMGHLLLGAAAGSVVLGYVFLMKIADIDS